MFQNPAARKTSGGGEEELAGNYFADAFADAAALHVQAGTLRAIASVELHGMCIDEL